MRFYAETKVRRRILNPILNSGFFDQLAEGEIYFYSVELRRVVAEEFFLCQLGGIEVGLPAWIRPSRGSGEELRHRRSGSEIPTRSPIQPAELNRGSHPHRKRGLYLAGLLPSRAL